MRFEDLLLAAIKMTVWIKKWRNRAHEQILGSTDAGPFILKPVSFHSDLGALAAAPAGEVAYDPGRFRMMAHVYRSKISINKPI